ncbi:hypothetical protein [Massilibacteroides sp.]|uniref:hypothetical protein n=1 Tax=Massilibacteroides sp. TaxID=2034766 RepID=UPI002603AB63|nr:hypothetical protein [Massilibacteroides sp.]MDD4515673.1 hypothetical protein [Massilibacteroides sp.]
MNIKELLERNYNSTVKRGLIKKETTPEEFINKIFDEYIELVIEHRKFSLHEDTFYELADIILVCLNFATHYDIDIFKYLEQKIEINENR